MHEKMPASHFLMWMLRSLKAWEIVCCLVSGDQERVQWNVYLPQEAVNESLSLTQWMTQRMLPEKRGEYLDCGGGVTRGAQTAKQLLIVNYIIQVWMRGH